MGSGAGRAPPGAAGQQWAGRRGGTAALIGEEFPSVLEAAKTGDALAIEAVYRDLAPVVLGYLRASGARDPEDLTGDVFVSVITSVGRFTGTEHQFRSWVLTIAHRRLVDDLRKRGRRKEQAMPLDSEGEPVIDLASDGNEAMARLRAKGVLAAIDQLTEDQRTILYLRVIADLPVADVAEIVGKAETAVKALQRRGLVRLRRVLAGEDGATEFDDDGWPRS
jgi:RNA polymerase sigma-70 factor (ECF subfamily)